MAGNRRNEEQARRNRDLSKRATSGADVIAESESEEEVEEQQPTSQQNFLQNLLREAKGGERAKRTPPKGRKTQKSETSQKSQKQQESQPNPDPVEPVEGDINDERATGRTTVGLCGGNHMRVECYWSYHDPTNSRSSWRLKKAEYRQTSADREAHRKCTMRRSAELVRSLAERMRNDLQRWLECQRRQPTRTSLPSVTNIHNELRPLVTHFLNGLSGMGSSSVLAPLVDTPSEQRVRENYMRRNRVDREEREGAAKQAVERETTRQSAAQKAHNSRNLADIAQGRVKIIPRPAVPQEVSEEDKKTLDAIRGAGQAEAKKLEQEEKKEEKRQRQKAAEQEPPTIKSQKLRSNARKSQEASASQDTWRDRLRSSSRPRPVIQDSDESDSVKAPQPSRPSRSTKKVPEKTSKPAVSSVDQSSAKKSAKASASTKSTKGGEPRKSTESSASTKTKETTKKTTNTKKTETKTSEAPKSTETISDSDLEEEMLAAFGVPSEEPQGKQVSSTTTEETTTTTPTARVDTGVGATVETTTVSVETEQQDGTTTKIEVKDTTQVVRSASEEGEVTVKCTTHTTTATASVVTESQASGISPVPLPKLDSEHDSDWETVSGSQVSHTSLPKLNSGNESDWETLSPSTSSSSSATKRKRTAAAEEADSGPDGSSQRGDTPSPSKKRRTVTPPGAPVAELATVANTQVEPEAVVGSPVLTIESQTAAPPSDAESSGSSKSSSSKKRKATWTEENGEVSINPSRTKRPRSEDGTADDVPSTDAAESGADDTEQPTEPGVGMTLLGRFRTQGWTEGQIEALAGEFRRKGT